jgi:hypothetical protein
VLIGGTGRAGAGRAGAAAGTLAASKPSGASVNPHFLTSSCKVCVRVACLVSCKE